MHDKNALKSKKIPVLRWEAGGRALRQTDEVAAEEPLEIRIDTRPVSVTMRTPGHDEELAAGFLLTEGLIKERGQIARMATDPHNESGNVLNVFLARAEAVDFAQLTRH